MKFSSKLILSISGLAVLAVLIVAGILLYQNSKREDITQGPFEADGRCPEFRAVYSRVEIRFGNAGLSTLNSIYETFVGEGAFEISEFRVTTFGPGRFNIVAQSNRGPLTSEIYADRLVRLGQDQENEKLRRTLQSAFCDKGRIYEHQLVDLGTGQTLSQDLEYWTEGDTLRFKLYQNRKLTADVVAQ